MVVCSLVFRSIPYKDALLLGNGNLFLIEQCQDENFRYLLQRLSQDIVFIMRDLNVNKVEVACLKGILLFDPGKFDNFQIFQG